MYKKILLIIWIILFLIGAGVGGYFGFKGLAKKYYDLGYTTSTQEITKALANQVNNCGHNTELATTTQGLYSFCAK